jgi:16S rRNA processing protein RimM
VRRAFGLKGELLVAPMTNEPDAVFASGRRLFAAAAAGAKGASRPYTVERSRPFKDGWLVKLAGVDDKTAADAWRGATLSAPLGELTPPGVNEVYLDELPGMQVRDEPHGEIGVVDGWYELPQGLVLEVRGPVWKADVPFNEAFVETVDRAARVIKVRLPDGMLESAASE